MKLLALLAGLSGFAHALDPVEGASHDNNAHRPPTPYESAVMGRRILALTKLGTFSTVFPDAPSGDYRYEHLGNHTDDDDNNVEVQENRPEGLGGVPFGLMGYVADCEEEGGNPTILAITIETTFKNARDGSNMTLSLQWTPPFPPARRIPLLERLGLSRYMPSFLSSNMHEHEHEHEHDSPDPVPYSAANLPRLALVGYAEPINPSLVDAARLTRCYLAKHGDAKYWLPGTRVHKSEWLRLVVTQVYWLGGFGDRAYIGWIPLEQWKKVTRAEWEGVRLPGEKKGWSEWSVEEAEEL